MRIGIKPGQNGLSADELQSLWRRADELGFESIWTYDHLTGEHCLEAITSLALMAAVTKRARIGCLVVIPGLRTTVSLAAELATIDAISRGRLEVGIGVSDNFARRDYDALGLPFPSPAERFQALESMVENLAELTGADSPLAAKSVQRPIPMLVGGRSEKIRALALRLGLAWNESATDVEAFAARASEQPDPQAQVFVRDLTSIEETVAAYRRAGATRLVLVMSPPMNTRDLEYVATQAGL